MITFKEIFLYIVILVFLISIFQLSDGQYVAVNPGVEAYLEEKMFQENLYFWGIPGNILNSEKIIHLP
ncbi:MAG: hypothetical protein PWQ82_238 [Thermosediminibacterales bacterium]|nr:hypothetical protein [Thermosediminibacterales bacterium]MDK2835260.1 hypothetical protein [Thermosediminibacterales bacterium]